MRKSIKRTLLVCLMLFTSGVFLGREVEASQGNSNVGIEFTEDYEPPKVIPAPKPDPTPDPPAKQPSIIKQVVLPQTGESDPWYYSLMGVAMLGLASVVIFKNTKKERGN